MQLLYRGQDSKSRRFVQRQIREDEPEKRPSLSTRAYVQKLSNVRSCLKCVSHPGTSAMVNWHPRRWPCTIPCLNLGGRMRSNRDAENCNFARNHRTPFFFNSPLRLLGGMFAACAIAEANLAPSLMRTAA